MTLQLSTCTSAVCTKREYEKWIRRTWGAVHGVGINMDDDKINNEENGKENGKGKQ